MASPEPSESSQPSTDLLTKFLQIQRTEPYHIFVSTLFAVILNGIAVWINQVTDVLDKVSAGSISKPVTIPQDLTIVQVSVFQYALAFLVFLFVIYLWLYFSRILVYLNEGPTGEMLTFVLGFVVLAAVYCLPILWPHWLFVFAVCTLFIFVKNLHVRKATSQDSDHPFNQYTTGWATFSGAYMVALTFVGIWGSLIKEQYQPIFQISSVVVIMVWSIFLIFTRFHPMERTLRDLMSSYANTSPHQQDFRNAE